MTIIDKEEIEEFRAALLIEDRAAGTAEKRDTFFAQEILGNFFAEICGRGLGIH